MWISFTQVLDGSNISFVFIYFAPPLEGKRSIVVSVCVCLMYASVHILEIANLNFTKFSVSFTPDAPWHAMARWIAVRHTVLIKLDYTVWHIVHCAMYQLN